MLGDTVEEIAAEKAGIIKEGGEVLCYPQSEGVMQVFEKACEACHGRMYEAAMPLRLVERSLYGQRFDLRIADEIAACCDRSDWVIRDLKITLPGTYQTKNAALAAQAACLLAAKGYPVTEESIRRGLRKTHWAGRFEWLDRSPDFIIDASHNLEGVEILKESLQRYFSDKPIVFIVGILRDKPYREMILPMLPLASEFYCVTIDSPRTLTAEELKQVIEEMGGQATACASVSDAVDRAELAAGSSGVVCAYGSLYYIGVVRGIVVGHRSSESK
ncbi:MAG: hypothetical protein IJV04_04055 [Lachnospiraceae bacterium]|nr:hypothetical protein [Lachnospiraceae bacterium]